MVRTMFKLTNALTKFAANPLNPRHTRVVRCDGFVLRCRVEDHESVSRIHAEFRAVIADPLFFFSLPRTVLR